MGADRTNCTNVGLTYGILVMGNGASATMGASSYIDDVCLIQSPTKVTINQSPAGGTVTGSVGGSTFSVLTGYYDTSEAISLVAAPSPGYQFLNWTSTGGWTSTSATVSYTPEAGNPTVAANFVHTGHQVSAAVCQTGGGAIAGANWYDPGTQVTLIATPNPGYSFVNWTSGSCGGASIATTTSYSFTMGSANVAFYANFAPRRLLTTAACPTAGGTSTPVSQYHDPGDSITLSATPNAGYSWGYWTANSCSDTTVLSTSQSYSTSMPSTDLALFAHFIANSYSLTASSCGGGAVGGPTGPTPTGTQVTLTATPNPGYWFNGWTSSSCSGTLVSRDTSYTFTMPPNDYDLHASFARAEFVEDLRELRDWRDKLR